MPEADFQLVRLIEEIHVRYPFFGRRRVRDDLEGRGRRVSRKHVQRPVLCWRVSITRGHGLLYRSPSGAHPALWNARELQ